MPAPISQVPLTGYACNVYSVGTFLAIDVKRFKYTSDADADASGSKLFKSNLIKILEFSFDAVGLNFTQYALCDGISPIFSATA